MPRSSYKPIPKKIYLVRANPGVDVGIRYTRKAANDLVKYMKKNSRDVGPHYSIEVYVLVV